MNEYYTYLYKDPKTDTPIYIGKGCKLRAYEHRFSQYRIGRTIRKRLKQGYNIDPIIVYHKNENTALAMEIFWIAVYGRENIKTGTLFNQTPGGEGGSGPMQDETKKKISNFYKIAENKEAHSLAAKTAFINDRSKYDIAYADSIRNNKIKDASIERWAKQNIKYKCVKCNKESRSQYLLDRWHNDKCKEK